MSIELLNDILEEIADMANIYGTCPVERDGLDGCPKRGCRCCIVADWDTRIRGAVEVERRLYGTAPDEEDYKP